MYSFNYIDVFWVGANLVVTATNLRDMGLLIEQTNKSLHYYVIRNRCEQVNKKKHVS